MKLEFSSSDLVLALAIVNGTVTSEKPAKTAAPGTSGVVADDGPISVRNACEAVSPAPVNP